MPVARPSLFVHSALQRPTGLAARYAGLVEFFDLGCRIVNEGQTGFIIQL